MVNKLSDITFSGRVGKEREPPLISPVMWKKLKGKIYSKDLTNCQLRESDPKQLHCQAEVFQKQTL